MTPRPKFKGKKSAGREMGRKKRKKGRYRTRGRNEKRITIVHPLISA